MDSPVAMSHRAQWFGLARGAATANELRTAGILPIMGDLDQRASLKRAGAMARAANAVLHLAPPPGEGFDDPRMRRWLAATAFKGTNRGENKSKLRPRRLRNVYVSTTGVYGDCGGERINETRRTRPANARAKRRVAAELRLRQAQHQRFTILRVPGIYSAERLPVERLRAGTAALSAVDDVFTNHIHADDLARAVWLAAFRGRPNRVLNIVDDAELKMGDYFDQVADATALPRPLRMPRAELARSVSPMLYSFMSESRRIDNTRMKRELRLQLRYATPAHFLRLMKPAAALQRSLL
ncbi:MAG: NAD-dependent epimerase/dehydratase family protein [Rhizobacter sp.]|nr:NAD-dependent epimerase/dehydratase family protein [Burkholderiales bacterium]